MTDEQTTTSNDCTSTVPHGRTFKRFWTPERIARGKELWRDGYSSTDIAAEFAGGPGRPHVTRNMVISKIHRDQWPAPHSKRSVMRNGATARTPMWQQRREGKPWGALLRAEANAEVRPPHDLKTPAASPGAPQASGPRALFGLREWSLSRPNDCRWPLGDWAKQSSLKHDPPVVLFCGAPTHGDLPYCIGHCRRAYGKAPPLRTDRALAPFPNRRSR